MSKWRPSSLNCIYVIPDIHGQYEQLNVILKRILPLRKSDGGKDILIFLGDYIDRHSDSHLVIDKLIEVQQKYPNQTIFLLGNHEQLLLNALDNSEDSTAYRLWMANGGEHTLSGYCDRKGMPQDNPYMITHKRIKDFIPKEHVNFMRNLIPYYEFENYTFVHAGCDPVINVALQKKDVLIWDRGLFKFCLKWDKKHPHPWEKTVVSGHSALGEMPFIFDKYMMLDISKSNSLLVAELRSMQSMIARLGNNRLILLDLNKCQF
jgi:serine/threonine protein phosphatase 1